MYNVAILKITLAIALRKKIVGLNKNLLVCKLSPVRRRQGEIERKEADHPALGGGSFNKQGKLHIRLVLGGCKMSRSLHLPTRVLRVYIEALMGFSHIQSPDGLNNILFSQGYILEMAPTMGTVSRTYIPRRGERLRSLQFPNCLSPAWGSTRGHVIKMTSSNKNCTFTYGLADPVVFGDGNTKTWCDRDRYSWMIRGLFLDSGTIGIYIKLGLGAVSAGDRLKFK